MRRDDMAPWTVTRPHARLFAVALLCACGCGGSCDESDGDDGTTPPPPPPTYIQTALEFAEAQLEASVTEIDDRTLYPVSALEGEQWSTGSAGGWTSGFWPGCLWLIHEHTGRADFRTWAEEWTANLESQSASTGSHDVGFQIFCSFGQGHRIAAVSGYSDVVLAAAGSLDTRYSDTVGCTRSWSWGTWEFPVIIDNMMNLEILMWSAANGGSADHETHALSHAHKTAANHVRADDTVYHVVDYDAATGDVIWRGHWQGYDDESTWARGMAWGIYGMTMVHGYTGDATALATARRLADEFLAELPADHVPYWDFEAPLIPDEPRDTSAAAITASALIELSQYVADPDGAAYYAHAEDILESLCTNYLADGTGTSSILTDGYYHGSFGMIFGDYYFLEALMRYTRGMER